MNTEQLKQYQFKRAVAADYPPVYILTDGDYPKRFKPRVYWTVREICNACLALSPKPDRGGSASPELRGFHDGAVIYRGGQHKRRIVEYAQAVEILERGQRVWFVVAGRVYRLTPAMPVERVHPVERSGS